MSYRANFDFMETYPINFLSNALVREELEDLRDRGEALESPQLYRCRRLPLIFIIVSSPCLKSQNIFTPEMFWP